MNTCLNRIADVFSNYDETLLDIYIDDNTDNLIICFSSLSKKTIILSEEISMIYPDYKCQIKMGKTMDGVNCRVIVVNFPKLKRRYYKS